MEVYTALILIITAFILFMVLFETHETRKKQQARMARWKGTPYDGQLDNPDYQISGELIRYLCDKLPQERHRDEVRFGPQRMKLLNMDVHELLRQLGRMQHADVQLIYAVTRDSSWPRFGSSTFSYLAVGATQYTGDTDTAVGEALESVRALVLAHGVTETVMDLAPTILNPREWKLEYRHSHNGRFMCLQGSVPYPSSGNPQWWVHIELRIREQRGQQVAAAA